MIGKVTYHQQVSYCGKPRCKKCREGTGHGPYWYSYQTVDGRTSRSYVGKTLPPEALEAIEGLRPPAAINQSELEQQKATIRIYTLGQFRLERRSSPSDMEWHTVTESAWQHQRVRALLGCLLSHPGRKLGREQIMDFLWPDLDFETGASRLDCSVYSLRQLFEPSRSKLATSPLVLTEREVLVLAEQSLIWVDSEAFDHLLLRAHESNDPGEKEKLLEEAMLLYGGDFLPEAQKIEWTRPRRESLVRAWIGLLLELSDLRNEREAYSSSIEPLDKLLSADPTNEAAVQRLMLRLSILGRRGEALRAYRKLTTVLQQEYHISPLPDTRAIYEKVRGGQPVSGSTSQASAIGSTQLNVQPASQVTPRSDAPPTIQIGRSHQSPLVGREQELSVLHELVTTTEQAAKFKLHGAKKSSMLALDTQRRPQCILLMGEVGIGKTRLAEEVSRDAKRRNWTVAWSRVYAQEGSIPYRLWTEVLRKAMEQGAWQRQEVSKRSLVFQPLSTLLPDVLQPLLMPVAFSSSLPPEQEQLRLWEAACELLKLISESTPLLIALDDLQWADASSCDLLAYLTRRIQGYPIMIVGTCRENELAASHPLRSLLTDLQREHSVECVSLEPLTDEQIDDLVSSVQLPQPLVRRVRNRVAGNPFFAEELARTLAAANFDAGAQGNRLTTPADVSIGDGTFQLPETITAVLDLRLGRLTQPCYRLLSKAAVLGGSFEFNVIGAMEATTPGSDEDVVLDLLEEALKSGMLAEQGTGTRITYEFWHPLLVTHLYEKLSAARRASLHRRAADIMQRLYKGREEEVAATITHHLVEGGADAAVIAKYAEIAGDRAYSLSSYAEAERYYQLALEHMEEVLQQQANLEGEKHLAYLLEYLGECTRFQGKDEEARRFYERVLEVRKHKKIVEQIVDVQREAQIDALLWCAIGWTWYNGGNNVEALRCYEYGVHALEAVDVLEGPAWANIRLQQSYVSWREGSYDDARVKASEALKLFNVVLEPQKSHIEDISRLSRIGRTLAGDPVDLGRTHLLLGMIAIVAGQSKDGLVYYNTALALYEQYDSLREIAIVCCDLGDVYLRRGEYLQAQAVLRRSLGIAERIGEVPLMSVALSNLGILDIRTGNLAEAETEFRKAIALIEQHVNDPTLLSIFHSFLANALQEQGKLSEVRAVICRALRMGRALHVEPYIGIALVAIGNLYIAQSNAIRKKDKSDTSSLKKSLQMLKRAENILKRAVTLEGIDVETRTEGQLALAQVALLAGELDIAQQQTRLTLEEANRFELIWLIARAQQLLGSVEAEQNQLDQASKHFEQALRVFRKSDMHLECARTLCLYGVMLVKQDKSASRVYLQGLNYLQEALRTFTECNANLDREMVERFLAEHNVVIAK